MTDQPNKPPRPPARLGSAGRKLWRTVVAAYTFRVDELVTLELACRALDDEVRLREALAESEVWVVGSTGQLMVTRLFSEVRQARRTVAGLLAQLGLPDPDERPDQAAEPGKVRPIDENATAKAQRAARARWGPR